MIMKILSTILFILFCATILLFSIRGIAGNPTSATINNPEWKDDGPLELSPDRGRFALMYSLVEDNSFFYSVPIARFATPDLGYVNGNYVSLFAPAVSFLIIPGYSLGKTIGIAQVGAFAVIALFALFNAFLLRSIAVKLGAHPLAAVIGALAFIFASPAFTYAVTLYQHHISTFLILLSIWILLRWKNIWSLGLIWFLSALSIPIDYPNLFLMLPIGVYALGRLIDLERIQEVIKIRVKLAGFLTFVTLSLPLAFFLWFNQMSYGNPFQLSGTVASVKAIDEQGKPAAPQGAGQENIERFLNPEKQEKSSIRFFQSRELLELLYIHFLSPDRGILFFTPIVLFGIFGMVSLYKQRGPILALLVSIIGFNVLLYSMFGEGGWAFGSRYLIPSYSIMAIFIALALTQLRKNFVFLFFFFVVLGYSLSVNALGALTSSRNPPKVEAVALEKEFGIPQKYSFDRNIDFLRDNRSKSFVYQTFAEKYVNALEYYIILSTVLVATSGALLTLLYFSKVKTSNG